jgi:deoxyribodipyrimidine photolyase-related protein
MSKTIWIQANQLARDNSALGELLRPEGMLLPAQVVMIESIDRSTQYLYQKRKLVLLFSAMRHFAAELRKRRLTVDYYALLDDGSHHHHSFEDALRLHIEKHHPSELVMMDPPDIQQQQTAIKLASNFGLPLRFTPNTNFLVDRTTFAEEHRSKKRLLMQAHYRRQRQRFGLLMDGDQPVGGKWSFDTHNRKRLPHERTVPRPVSFLPDQTTREAIQTVDTLFPHHPGSTAGFDLPVTHSQAIALVDDFIENRLRLFGDFQSAMAVGEPLLYHSFLSPFLNIGLLSPLHLLKKIEHAYTIGLAPLNAVEGFIRQVLGWREYMYGSYHALMPSYRRSNFLDARRKLPSFFWTGRTDMKCLAETTTQAIRGGYLHQIQRLMVICNFATLCGIKPAALLNWFMTLFLDAYEWVMVPNVLGMGTFADGGRISTKPYVAGGAYIKKMSDYCTRCHFSVDAKTGPDACPFNYVYWNFLERNKAKLSSNLHLAIPYRLLQEKSSAEKRAIRVCADDFLKTLSR